MLLISLILRYLRHTHIVCVCVCVCVCVYMCVSISIYIYMVHGNHDINLNFCCLYTQTWGGKPWQSTFIVLHISLVQTVQIKRCGFILLMICWWTNILCQFKLLFVSSWPLLKAMQSIHRGHLNSKIKGSERAILLGPWLNYSCWFRGQTIDLSDALPQACYNFRPPLSLRLVRSDNWMNDE